MIHNITLAKKTSWSTASPSSSFPQRQEMRATKTVCWILLAFVQLDLEVVPSWRQSVG